MNSFLRSCWLSSIVTTLLVFISASVAWKATEPKLPPAPDISLFNKVTYISAYAGLGTTMHYIYQLGLFGMRERLQKSDILLLGSSHVEFDLSAARLSQRLSNFSGHPVTVYNVGIGCGEGIGFGEEICASNKLEKKAVILDLFRSAGDGVSVFGQTMLRSNSLRGYCFVFDLWLKAFTDYCLDPFVPHMTATDFTTYTFTRALGSVEIRDWKSGDAVELWSANQGAVFSASVSTGTTRNGKPAYAQLTNQGVAFDSMSREAVSKLQLSPVYTVLPFGGYERALIPSNAVPFIPLSDEGISFWDEQAHVTAASREILTDRLARGLESAHVFPELLAPRPR